MQRLHRVCRHVHRSTVAQKYKTDIPPAITIPDSVETRLGTFDFIDGFPDDATVQKVYDNLDFQRGVQAFLTAMPAASLGRHAQGIRSFGPDNQTVIIFETLMDSRSLFLTANTESVYAVVAGPEERPDASSKPTQHLGPRRRLLVPLRHRPRQRRARQGQGRQVPLPAAGLPRPTPDGLLRLQVAHLRQSFRTRGFLVNGDPKPAVDSIKQHLRIYPLAQAANPPATNFVNVSGKASTPSTRWTSPSSRRSTRSCRRSRTRRSTPKRLGLLASIGIEKGKPFAPDARMKKILTEAAVGRQRNGAHLRVQIPHTGAYLLSGQRLVDAVRRRQLRVPE